MLVGKNILIVTYDWMPRSSIGVHRPLSWARYLSKNNNVTVITSKKKSFDGPLNLTLSIDSSIEVIELDYSIADGSKRFLNSFVFFLGNILPFWLIRALKEKVLQITNADFDIRDAWSTSVLSLDSRVIDFADIVISTYGPRSAHMIGSKIKAMNPRVCWVADYRDLWSKNPYAKLTKRRQLQEQKLEIETCQTADLVTTISPVLAIELESLLEKSVCVIYNGFDEISRAIESKAATARITILYTGLIYKGRRSPRVLAEALDRLCSEDASALGKFTVELVGPNTRDVVKELEVFNCRDRFVLRDQVSFAVSLKAQREADLLLLMGSGQQDDNGVLPGKLFEYLAASRPIVSIGSSANSQVAEILRTTGAGKAYGDDSVALCRDLDRFINSGRFDWYSPNLSEIMKYKRAVQAERLAGYVEENYFQ